MGKTDVSCMGVCTVLREHRGDGCMNLELQTNVSVKELEEMTGLEKGSNMLELCFPNFSFKR